MNQRDHQARFDFSEELLKVHSEYLKINKVLGWELIGVTKEGHEFLYAELSDRLC